MYRVYLRVESDGDFSYVNPIKNFNLDDGEIEMFFNDRKELTKAIREFCNSIINTIETEKEYMSNTINQIKSDMNTLNLIIGRFECFELHLDYGNQEIELWILPIEYASFHVYDNNDIILSTIKCGRPLEGTDDFPIYGNEFRSFDVEKIKELSDIYGEDSSVKKVFYIKRKSSSKFCKGEFFEVTIIADNSNEAINIVKSNPFVKGSWKFNEDEIEIHEIDCKKSKTCFLSRSFVAE